MAEFIGNLQGFKPTLPNFLEMDSNIELLNQFAEMNQSVLENPNLALQNIIGFSNDNFLSQQQPDFSFNFPNNLIGMLHFDGPNAVQNNHAITPIEDVGNGSIKRKKASLTESSSGNSSTPVTENAKNKRKNISGRGKRGKNKEKKLEEQKEVIHVRARRGQATDSHSLAERVRRERINEKLRCLQDLVPGCYKTMGMAVMLDEIITYVQSLQNQVEFLSMKLTAASNFYDFNSDIDIPQGMQGTISNAYEAQEMVERLVRGGYGGVPSAWPL
ncbi:hypothetical protein GIB67_012604 [Kingdonia uniflora]|uniref:BHLH domain-containing protein n=1 Tax=Kingdonia uniflora TaxID=39325 RepID=A0A7J7NEX2_9MAGN|nr:hypothetical protein GIB67_012604 [Kingdonia uniflora]